MFRVFGFQLHRIVSHEVTHSMIPVNSVREATGHDQGIALATSGVEQIRTSDDIEGQANALMFLAEAQAANIRLQAMTELGIRRILTPQQLETLRNLRAPDSMSRTCNMSRHATVVCAGGYYEIVGPGGWKMMQGS